MCLYLGRGGGDHIQDDTTNLALLTAVIALLVFTVLSLVLSLQSVIPSFILSLHIGDILDGALVEATVLAQLQEEMAASLHEFSQER